jgi:signal transduction histidine kinase
MFKMSIVYKLGLAIMLITLSVLLPLGYSMNRMITDFYFSKTESDIRDLSEAYARLMQMTGEPGALLERWPRTKAQGVAVVDPIGKIVAHSGIRNVPIDQKDLKRLSRGQSIVRRTDGHQIDYYLMAASPVFDHGLFKGAVYVIAPVDEIHRRLATVRTSIFLSVIGAFFLALGFTYFLSRKLSLPLLKMESATKRIARGDLSARIDWHSKDELGSLARSINDLAVELERYRTNRSEFLGNISHELRTPMTYLSGYANALRQKLYKTEEEMEQYATIIEEEAKRLQHLINDLFDLAKMEEGKFELNLELVDLDDMLKNNTNKIKIAAQKKGLNVLYRSTGENHVILGDPLRLNQIFMNLLTNAVRYTSSGKIEVSLAADQKHEIVRIKDTGQGIPADALQRIFDRFYRVEKSRSRDTGGSGLGLAIVKELVHLHQGQIGVESDVGKGTCITVRFPRVQEGDDHEVV